MADGMRATTPTAEDDYHELQAEHDELVALTPSQREKLEAKAARLASRELGTARVEAWARLRPADRELFEKAIEAWGMMLKRSRSRVGVDPLVAKVWKGGKRRAAEKMARKRFASQAIDPQRVTDLDEANTALEEARTIFPKSVVDAWDTDRLLVSGVNNAKLGGKIEKGEWAGFPLFHLTLEERATCPGPDPRTGEGGCPLWAGCYGNAMHLARRHNARSENFLDFLQAELWLMARAFPKGYAVRLHTLGDFFSVAYVDFWADLVDRIGPLHVFGYTARTADDPIGARLREVVESRWSKFAIRWSTTPGPQGTVVVTDLADAGDAIPCPAQHTAAQEEAKTDACSTCGLCWSASARDKTIAFLRHGMKVRA